MAVEIVVSWKDFNALLSGDGRDGASHFWLDAPDLEERISAIGLHNVEEIRALRAARTCVMLVPKAGRNPGSVLFQEVPDMVEGA
jgi:hypothetical protein